MIISVDLSLHQVESCSKILTMIEHIQSPQIREHKVIMCIVCMFDLTIRFYNHSTELIIDLLTKELITMMLYSLM